MTNVRELHKKWLKNLEYKAAYDDMAEEFAEKMDAKLSLGAQLKVEIRTPLSCQNPANYYPSNRYKIENIV